MKIITYNVNGIRAALQKGLLDVLQREQPEVVCFQELKALPDQIPQTLFEELGYHCYWFSAEKKGYSGVGMLSKIKPDKILYGCNEPWLDREGRNLTLCFNGLAVSSLYLPSGTTGDVRQDYKYQSLDYYFKYFNILKQDFGELIVSGDFNICHQPIDIHDPKGNAQSSGFLPEERAWFSRFLDSGWVDAFRHINPELAHTYSWWTFRAGARSNNKGWRIDYHLTSPTLSGAIQKVDHLKDDLQSDHCAVSLLINV